MQLRACKLKGWNSGPRMSSPAKEKRIVVVTHFSSADLVGRHIWGSSQGRSGLARKAAGETSGGPGSV